MTIDVAEGVLIEGDEEELRGLAETIGDAIEHGTAQGNLLTEEGVEDVTVRLLDSLEVAA